MSTDASGRKVVCQNRKARHLYHIEDVIEAGLVLSGTEVKSLRQGQGSIVEAHCQPYKGELFLIGCHIPPYEHGNIHNVDSTRRRKLLLKKKEVEKLAGAVSKSGYALVPLEIYFKRGWAKVAVALAKGKKLHDRREDLKKKDQERDMARVYRRG